MPSTSPHPTPHHSLPAGAPTVPSSRAPPQCCLSPRLSLGLKSLHLPGIFGYQNSPGFPMCPVMHPDFPVHCGCPAALHIPAVPQGHLSPSTAQTPSEPCRCTVVPLPAEPPRAMAPPVLFLPQNTPIVPKTAAGAAGPGAMQNPHFTFYFQFFPFFFPVFLVFQLSVTPIPQQTTLPAPTTDGGSGPWALLGAEG